MKRILPVILVLVLTLALMIVPAFADELFTISRTDDAGFISSGFVPVAGTYVVRIYTDIPNWDIDDGWYESEPFELLVEGDPSASWLYVKAWVVVDGKRFLLQADLFVESNIVELDVYQFVYDDVSCTDASLQNMQFVPYSPAGQPGSDNEEGGVLAMIESVVSAIFAVFTAIGNWFVEFLPTLTALFWTGEALTFLGVLAILGLGVSVIFLLINVIRGFLNFGR